MKKYYKMPKGLMSSKEISTAGKLVYMFLLDLSDIHEIAFPKQRTIARALNISLRSVNKAVSELREKGLVTTGSGIATGTPLYYTVKEYEENE